MRYAKFDNPEDEALRIQILRERKRAQFDKARRAAADADREVELINDELRWRGALGDSHEQEAAVVLEAFNERVVDADNGDRVEVSDGDN